MWNALLNIEQSKLYEVQKTLNFSNHSWSCFWLLANPDAWGNVAKLASSLTEKLKGQGMQTFTCDIATFKAKLGPYYAKWKTTFGTTAWNLLERYSGWLA